MRLILLLFILTYQSLLSQDNNKPKLVVGIVIDQMRAEYLYRFQDNYSEKGFKKIIANGFNVKNTHYNYIPTSTGPGHASIFTGTTPSEHGIIGNYWYDKESQKEIYCAEDSLAYKIDTQYTKIAIESSSNFKRSPRNLMSTTITDELKLFTNMNSKVIGISIKDRSAILPAGHLADYAFWYNTVNGNFVTSSYYTNELPQWLVKFNNTQTADSLLNSIWEPLMPIKSYTNSDVDNAPFEKKFIDKKEAVFPYNLKKLRKKNGNFALLTEIPFGNTLVTKMALATIKGEALGKGKETDFLTISYSSTDYVGHNFGIRSKELEDAYIRMDREIATLLTSLDNEVGKGNYLLFITADHAARDNPEYLKRVRLPGEFYNYQDIKNKLNMYLSQEFGEANYVTHIGKSQIYINNAINGKSKILKKASLFLNRQEAVKEVCIPSLSTSCNSFMKKGYHGKRSGDLLIEYSLGWMSEMNFGTTHGSSNNNDTHVPLIWYGHNILHGQTTKYYTITQIASTLSFLLNIPLPNVADKEPIRELFD